jgi:hypothetical protein
MCFFKRFPPTLIATFLAVISILTQAVPEISLTSRKVSFNSAVKAQEISDQQVRNYARAVLDIESHRKQAFEEIQDIMGGSTPEIVCNQPSSYSNLPQQAQEIALEYCQISQDIVESTGMSVREFNQITQRIKSEPQLEQRIQQVMMEMQ